MTEHLFKNKRCIRVRELIDRSQRGCAPSSLWQLQHSYIFVDPPFFFLLFSNFAFSLKSLRSEIRQAFYAGEKRSVESVDRADRFMAHKLCGTNRVGWIVKSLLSEKQRALSVLKLLLRRMLQLPSLVSLLTEGFCYKSPLYKTS